MKQLKIKTSDLTTNEGYKPVSDKNIKKMRKKLEEENPNKEVRTVLGNVGFTIGK